MSDKNQWHVHVTVFETNFNGEKEFPLSLFVFEILTGINFYYAAYFFELFFGTLDYKGQGRVIIFRMKDIYFYVPYYSRKGMDIFGKQPVYQ